MHEIHRQTATIILPNIMTHKLHMLWATTVTYLHLFKKENKKRTIAFQFPVAKLFNGSQDIAQSI